MSHPSTRVYYIVFIALLVLLVVTVGAADINLGRWNFLLAVTIATTKAALILLYFMHLRYSPRLIWLLSGGSLFFLAILFVITLSDYFSRGWLSRASPPPASVAIAGSDAAPPVAR
jgi:cytochrome c oxidase subunit 4